MGQERDGSHSIRYENLQLVSAGNTDGSFFPKQGKTAYQQRLEYFKSHLEHFELVPSFSHSRAHARISPLSWNNDSESPFISDLILAIAEPDKVLNQNGMGKGKRLLSSFYVILVSPAAVNLQFVVKDNEWPGDRSSYIGRLLGSCW